MTMEPSRAPALYRDEVKETLDRVRRIETKLTVLANKLSVKAKGDDVVVTMSTFPYVPIETVLDMLTQTTGTTDNVVAIVSIEGRAKPITIHLPAASLAS